MRTRGMVLVVVLAAGVGCLGTARYDQAHMRRVMSIQTKYEAEVRRQDTQYAAQLAALEAQRAGLIPVAPGASALRPIVACPQQRATLGEIDAQLARFAGLRAQAQRHLERARDAELRRSQQQRDTEVAANRARLRAQANAAAEEQGRPAWDGAQLGW